MPVAEARVPVVPHPLDQETFLSEHVLARQPVVIRAGDLERLDWRTGRWTPEYLGERVGPRPVSVQVRKSGPFGSTLPGSGRVRMPFDRFVRQVMASDSGDESLYLNLQGMSQQLTAPLLQLLGDFTLPRYFRDAAVRWINLWMGHNSTRTKSQLHHDYHDNLYVVVRGRKSFVLFPPRDLPFLYTRGRPLRADPNGVVHYGRQAVPEPHFSVLDTEKADLERYPKFAFARPRRITVEQGDLLYLPAGWFHEVSSEGLHVAVNFWADPPANDQVKPVS